MTRKSASFETLGVVGPSPFLGSFNRGRLIQNYVGNGPSPALSRTLRHACERTGADSGCGHRLVSALGNASMGCVSSARPNMSSLPVPLQKVQGSVCIIMYGSSLARDPKPSQT
jgi:hypothetical protein